MDVWDSTVPRSLDSGNANVPNPAHGSPRGGQEMRRVSMQADFHPVAQSVLYTGEEIRIFPMTHMESAKQTDVLNTSLLAVTQTAVGCGLGLLLGGKMSRGAQKTTAFSLLGIGALLALPAIIDAVKHLISGPATERGARKRLDSIRHDSGMPDDAEVF